MDLKSHLQNLSIPMCLLVLALFLRPYSEQLLTSTLWLEISGIIFLLVPGILCLRFQKVTEFFFILALFVFAAIWTSSNLGLLESLENLSTQIQSFLFLALPLQLLYLALLPPQSLLGARAKGFIFLLALEIGVVALIIKGGEITLLTYAAQQLWQLPFNVSAPSSQISLALLSLSILVQFVRFVISANSCQANLLGAFFLLTISSQMILLPHTMALMLIATGIMLSIGVIQDSHDMAFTDPLTRLPGRRSLEHNLKQVGKRYTIAMLDIDHFKKLNDRYGHDVGDQVLKMVAKHIRKVSGGGKPARYGGEEFAIVFPGKSLLDAVPHVEAIRLHIENSPFFLRDKDRPQKIPTNNSKQSSKLRDRIHVTISIGVAERSRINRSTEQVMKAADACLYTAKKKGRNQVSY